MAHAGQNTGDTEWFTPAVYAEAARRVLGVTDLDPASTRGQHRDQGDAHLDER